MQRWKRDEIILKEKIDYLRKALISYKKANKQLLYKNHELRKLVDKNQLVREKQHLEYELDRMKQQLNSIRNNYQLRIDKLEATIKEQSADIIRKEALTLWKRGSSLSTNEILIMQILKACEKKPSISQIEQLSKLPRQTTYDTIGYLRKKGLIKTIKKGKCRLVSLTEKHIPNNIPNNSSKKLDGTDHNNKNG